MPKNNYSSGRLHDQDTATNRNGSDDPIKYALTSREHTAHLKRKSFRHPLMVSFSGALVASRNARGERVGTCSCTDERNTEAGLSQTNEQ